MALQADQASASTTSIEKVENDESDLRSSDLAPHDANVEEFGPRYADLPMEILIKIFSYLTSSDRREAGLACRRWCEAAHHAPFLDGLWLVLERIHFDESELPMRLLLHSPHHFPNIELRGVDFEQLGNFFPQFGPHIRRIAFVDCNLQLRTLYDILSHLSGLRSLSIRYYRNLSFVRFENPTERAALRQTLSSVTELSLVNFRHFTDAILDQLVEIMPSLCSLRLESCLVPFQYNKQMIDERKLCIGMPRVFVCCRRTTQDRSLEVLASMAPELQLKRLELTHTKMRHQGPMLGTLLRTQANHLQHLNLSHSYQLTDSCLVQICQELPGLRVLKMRGCRTISNQGVRELSQLTQLEVLDISNCKAINGEGILDGIASKKNDVLRELYIRELNLTERSIIAITETLGELRVLDIGYCFQGMSDLCMQLICRNLVRLTQLALDSCTKMWDVGLTGLGMVQHVHMVAVRNGIQYAQQEAAASEAEEAPPEPTVPLTLPFRNSLRSRAEQEIVNAPKRQRMEVMQQKESLSQQASSSTAAFSGYSIERLQQLRVLNLAGCNSLTDVSLLFNFRLVELRELSLARCKQLTHEGIQAVVRRCSAIEQLDLSECCNIKDETVLQVVIHLRRLRVLSLRGCYQLTDYSLDHFACHCHRLRVLDVRDCKQMDGEPARRLVNLKQLTTLRKSEHKVERKCPRVRRE
ncbi:hypothetical protein ZHAS_00019449 [Anopheles sinensis]|uniref:F-box domain-containing protein n=1 Tax=Anopheles sinensis TaxID=74873 RepID=A0A084WLU3_ANOSI|nr:hypothetical protein ZHAS_00019449 [Anopheles sinensis]